MSRTLTSAELADIYCCEEGWIIYVFGGARVITVDDPADLALIAAAEKENADAEKRIRQKDRRAARTKVQRHDRVDGSSGSRVRRTRLRRAAATAPTTRTTP